jgi:hypothetical protein
MWDHHAEAGKRELMILARPAEATSHPTQMISAESVTFDTLSRPIELELDLPYVDG